MAWVDTLISVLPHRNRLSSSASLKYFYYVFMSLISIEL